MNNRKAKNNNVTMKCFISLNNAPLNNITYWFEYVKISSSMLSTHEYKEYSFYGQHISKLFL